MTATRRSPEPGETGGVVHSTVPLTEVDALRREAEKLLRERMLEVASLNRSLELEVSQRKRAEQGHRDALRRLVEAQEMERRRVSRELHDQFGQELTALKLGLRMLKNPELLKPEVVRQCVERLEKLADRLMQDVHRLAWELRPVVLDDFGLELALQRYIAEWAEQSQVPVDFHARGLQPLRLRPEVETMLYRVSQEALTNVSRHAQARRVSVLVECREEVVSLIVEDDGIGFDVQAEAVRVDAGKIGLTGMRERVSLVGGRIDIESGPGAGTTVFVRVSLAAVDTARA